MNVPGFTAEASFYRTRRHYQIAGTVIRAGESIYPAQLSLLGYQRARRCYPQFERVCAVEVYTPWNKSYPYKCVRWDLEYVGIACDY